jgi:hypothetical protein
MVRRSSPSRLHLFAAFAVPLGISLLTEDAYRYGWHASPWAFPLRIFAGAFLLSYPIRWYMARKWPGGMRKRPRDRQLEFLRYSLTLPAHPRRSAPPTKNPAAP